ncbi:MAG: hypothetical protein IJ389_05415 [Clostridia bacterium]|nr:hypothetical protein [Clostridia bacterium]
MKRTVISIIIIFVEVIILIVGFYFINQYQKDKLIKQRELIANGIEKNVNCYMTDYELYKLSDYEDDWNWDGYSSSLELFIEDAGMTMQDFKRVDSHLERYTVALFTVIIENDYSESVALYDFKMKESIPEMWISNRYRVQSIYDVNAGDTIYMEYAVLFDNTKYSTDYVMNNVHYYIESCLSEEVDIVDPWINIEVLVGENPVNTSESTVS